MRKVRAVIVDDELIARQTIRLLLQDDPEIEIVEECSGGSEAVDALRRESPDLVLLDIQMPRVNGFEVIRRLGPSELPEIVFVTAFDEFAVQAFEVHALDYLLKPFSDERFRETLQHAKERIRGKEIQKTGTDLAALLEGLEKRVHPVAERAPAEQFLSRFVVKSPGRFEIVSVDDVAWIEAQGNYVRLHGPGKSHLLRETMNGLERLLSPRVFIRIHRSTIVRVDRIRSLRPLESGDY
ncbi:MAG: response regulator [Bacteroidota bacterium]